ncbi:MAG TPA: TRAP transporter small permease [Nitrospinota bacterium]|nr:TRAP transporter small permease [Nitrospinota bacterium]|tara:strand:+ start:859 stop:1398 length:540 start_codon:yes stop_codon:yes gene_type:complete
MRRPFNLIQLTLQFDSCLARIEEFLLILILSFMVFFSFLQVIFRNIFSEGIPGADIFLRHLVLWIAFIGAALTTRYEKHISIDILSRFFNNKLNAFRKILINVISGSICCYLTRASWVFMIDEKMSGSELFSGIPTWYFLIVLPFAFTIITFRFYLKTVSGVLELLQGPGIRDHGSEKI